MDLGIAQNGYQAFRDILNNAGDEFEREWESAFTTSNSLSSVKPNSPSTQNDFNFFSESSLIGDGLDCAEPSKLGDLFHQDSSSQILSENDNKSSLTDKSDEPGKSSNKKNLSAWYDLFAELDPLKNPDAIGQQEGIEEERNC